MKNPSEFRGISLVRLTGLEPALLAELEPKSNVYANFTTGAYLFCFLQLGYYTKSFPKSQWYFYNAAESSV